MPGIGIQRLHVRAIACIVHGCVGWCAIRPEHSRVATVTISATEYDSSANVHGYSVAGRVTADASRALAVGLALILFHRGGRIVGVVDRARVLTFGSHKADTRQQDCGCRQFDGQVFHQ